MLIEKVAGGGNLLLNIGPTPDGRIPVIMQQRLADIGEWLKINGEAIFKTTAVNMPKASVSNQNIFYTKKGTDLYVICKTWLSKLEIPLVCSAPEVSLLGTNLKVNYKNHKNKMVIEAPQISPANIPCDYAWVYVIRNAFKEKKSE